MKKFFAIALVALAALVSLSSCNKEEKTGSIVGTWKCVDASGFISISVANIISTSFNLNDPDSGVEFKDTAFKFTEDGEFYVDGVRQGTYTYADGTLKVDYTDKTDVSANVPFNVKKLNSDTLVLTANYSYSTAYEEIPELTMDVTINGDFSFTRVE